MLILFLVHFNFDNRKNNYFNSVGDRWRQLRTAANPVVARPATIHSYIDKYSIVVNDFIEYLSRKFETQESTTILLNDFSGYLHYLSLECNGLSMFRYTFCNVVR